MDVLGVFGLSNFTVLAVAAAIGVGAALISLAFRALRDPGGERVVARKIDRLEMHLAFLGEGETVSTAREFLCRELNAPDTAALEDLFAGTVGGTGFFATRSSPRQVAEFTAMELTDSMDIVRQIGRIVLNAYEGGSLEVASHRRDMMHEIKELAGSLGSETWKKQGARLMSGAMPDQATILVATLFNQTHELKLTVSGLPKDPGVDGLITILERSIGIAKANERTSGFLNADAA